MLRDMAELRGCSISALIREGVDSVLAPSKEQRRQAERASTFVGRYASGRSNMAEDHDEAFAEAILSPDDTPA